jgi:TIR domain
MVDESKRPLLFISHKHENSALASALREFVKITTAGKVEVFQSSSEQAETTRAGQRLDQELKKALWRSDAFIMLYTYKELDWSYCMYEYGIADHKDSADTRIILFRCCNDEPALFAGQVNVNVRDPDSILKFTKQFLPDRDFFPSRADAITDHASASGAVTQAAEQLFKTLLPLLPPLSPTQEEWPAHPFLRLQLDRHNVETIKKAKGPGGLKKANALILDQGVVNGYDKYAEQLFNSPGFEKGMTLASLVRMWSESNTSRDSGSRWVDSLCNQVAAGARWRFPPSNWELMQAVDGRTWHAPMVTRVRRLPDHHMEFDIYFFKFDVDDAHTRAKIGHPDA